LIVYYQRGPQGHKLYMRVQVQLNVISPYHSPQVISGHTRHHLQPYIISSHISSPAIHHLRQRKIYANPKVLAKIGAVS
jgi:hypothetical protein